MVTLSDCTQNYGNGVISQLATWY